MLKKWLEYDHHLHRLRFYGSGPVDKHGQDVSKSETGWRPVHFAWVQYYWKALHWYLLFLYDTLMFFFRVYISFPLTFFRIFMKEKVKSIEGDFIVVTGAGSGLGRCIAFRLAELGANVICWDIQKDKLEETVSKIREDHPKSDPHGFTIDVTERNAVLTLAEEIREDIGRVSMLVNCARINPSRFFMHYNHKEVNRMLDINLRSHFWTIEAFLPQMKEEGKGHIVSVGSLASRFGNHNMVPVCASFYGAHGLMESLEHDLRFYDYDYIKVTTAFPYYKKSEEVNVKSRIRFPNWMKQTSTEQAAKCITDAVLRDRPYVWIPFYTKYLHYILELLPRPAVMAFNEYMELACDPYDQKYNYKGERIIEEKPCSSDQTSRGSRSP